MATLERADPRSEWSNLPRHRAAWMRVMEKTGDVIRAAQYNSGLRRGRGGVGFVSEPEKMKAAGGTRSERSTIIRACREVCFHMRVCVCVCAAGRKRRDAAGEECSHGCKVGVKTTVFTDL